jgi:hypothetical protein
MRRLHEIRIEITRLRMCLAPRVLASFFLALLAASLLGFGQSPVSARPIVPAERRYSPFEGILPPCHDAAVLDRIRSRFADREKEFWSTGLLILRFDKINEVGYRSNGLDHIPRRYCAGQVILNDQRARSVTYSIAEDQGAIGFTFGVDWCVGGLDRLDAYAPHCTMARP